MISVDKQPAPKLDDAPDNQLPSELPQQAEQQAERQADRHSGRRPSQPSVERQILDETGTVWRVTEMRVWDASGRSTSSLIAAHEYGFRRLWDFPANWPELPDAELAELVSKPVRKTRSQAAS
jgi:hypothetical protein